MTDLKKAWDDAHKAQSEEKSEPVKKGVDTELIEAMSAQMNNVENKLDQLLQDKGGNTGGGAPAEQSEDAALGLPNMEGAMPGGEAQGGAAEGIMPPAAGNEGGMPPAETGSEESGAMMPQPDQAIIDQLMGVSAQAPPAAQPDMTANNGVDKTLAALQGALTEADDKEVIRNLTEITLDYIDKTDAMESSAMTAPAAAPAPEQTLDDIPPEELLQMIAEMSGSEIGDQAAALDMMSAMASAHADKFKEFINSIKKSKSGDSTDITELFQSLTRKFEEDEKKDEKKDDEPKEEKSEEKTEEKSDEKKEESTSENEDGEKKEDGPKEEKSEEKTETESSEEKSESDNMILPDGSGAAVITMESNESSSESPAAEEVAEKIMTAPEILDMSFGDVLNVVIEQSPADDVNAFISGGEPTDAIAACKGSDIGGLTKSNDAFDLDSAVRDFSSMTVSGDSVIFKNPVKKSAEQEEAEKMVGLVRSLSTKKDICEMTVGQVFDSMSTLKSAGVTDVERRCADAIDVIARYTDKYMGGTDATDVLMCSMGVDMDKIFKSPEAQTEPTTKSVQSEQTEPLTKAAPPIDISKLKDIYNMKGPINERIDLFKEMGRNDDAVRLQKLLESIGSLESFNNNAGYSDRDLKKDRLTLEDTENIGRALSAYRDALAGLSGNADPEALMEALDDEIGKYGDAHNRIALVSKLLGVPNYYDSNDYKFEKGGIFSDDPNSKAISNVENAIGTIYAKKLGLDSGGSRWRGENLGSYDESVNMPDVRLAKALFANPYQKKRFMEAEEPNENGYYQNSIYLDMPDIMKMIGGRKDYFAGKDQEGSAFERDRARISDNSNDEEIASFKQKFKDRDDANSKKKDAPKSDKPKKEEPAKPAEDPNNDLIDRLAGIGLSMTHGKEIESLDFNPTGVKKSATPEDTYHAPYNSVSGSTMIGDINPIMRSMGGNEDFDLDAETARMSKIKTFGN